MPCQNVPCQNVSCRNVSRHNVPCRVATLRVAVSVSCWRLSDIAVFLEIATEAAEEADPVDENADEESPTKE